jgi:hypothetical protein
LRVEGGEVVTPDGQRYPVRVVEWDEQTEAAAMVAANSELLAGEFDEGALEEVLAGIEDKGLLEDLRLDELSVLDRDTLEGFERKQFEGGEEPAAAVRVKAGEYEKDIEREVYERWREEIQGAVGFEHDAIMAEILRRLGIVPTR